ncbi:hypothetical protein [Microcoleus sp. AR_TQ3_B6]|uniref:hypothetical protein n=1 Tax=Microcoleus sp. AR_TQ3_B6 TaxID=3055284 RepID=UPI002FD6D0B8
MACSRAMGHNIKFFEEERSDVSFDLFGRQLQPYTGPKYQRGPALLFAAKNSYNK